MKILFINTNLYGHINPTLGLVKNLTKSGNRVDYFCAEPFLESVTRVGAKWIGYSSKLDGFFKEYRPTDRHPFYMLLEYMLLYDETVLPEILDFLKKEPYDMIICDSYFGGACFLREIVDIPIVCSHSSFAMSHTPMPGYMLEPGFHPQLDNCYRIIKRICIQYKIEEPTIEQIFISKGDLNLVYTIQAFNGDEEVSTPEYLFVGPSMNRLQEVSGIDFTAFKNRKLIYISLGSLNTEFVDFYMLCILAFRDTNDYVVMSIGKKCDLSALGEIPSNFLVKDYLPQLEILKRADIFITHAGFNSVNEALYFGVPMLALPQVNDQKMVAARLASMKLGLTEDMKELTPKALREKTGALMMNAQIKENCINISHEMRASSQMEQTIKELKKYANNWKGKKYGSEE